jgi:hypothetical protein
MRGSQNKTKKVLFGICIAVFWEYSLGCNSVSRSFGDGDDDVGTDSDTTLTVDCEGIPWGTQWVVGQTVANINIAGFADTDGDHQVEQTETTFSFEDIACAGFESVLIVWANWCST